MANNEQSLKYNENIGLYESINPILNLKDLNRKQVKELAKEIANNESQTHSWQEVSNDAVNYDSKNKRQEKRFKRIFNKQLNENLAPILEKQHKQELIDRMKSGDTSAMSQGTTEGINKFGHQFMPVMLTAATLPFGIGAFGQAVNTIGLLPAIGAEAGSGGLGYGGYKLGSKLDDDFGTNGIAPALSAASGIGGYGAGYKGMVKLGSRGWLPKGDKFIYSSQFVGDVAADGLKRGIRTTRLSQPLLEPVTRFKLGDIEINDPSLYYRQGTKEMGDDLIESGVVRGTTPETIKKVYALPGSRIQLTKAFSKPMFNQGKLFFGVKENFPDLIVAGPSAPMFPAHKGGNIVDISHINSVNVKSRRIPGIELTSDQVSLYRLDPDYGYRIVKPEAPTIDRIFGIRNRVFTGNPVFQKDNGTIPAFNTNSAYRLTGQSQIDDMIQTGFIRPKAGKIRGGHTNEVHWSIGHPRFGYNGGEGQYVLESPLGLVDETDVALNVKDLSHIWTVRNGQLVDVIDEVRPHMRTVDSPLSKGSYTFFERPSKLTLAERMGIPKGDRGSLTQDQLEGLEDLMHYNTSGKYRGHLTYNDKTGFARTTAANRPEGSIQGVQAMINRGVTQHGGNGPMNLATKTGTGTIGPTRKNFPAKFSGGDFPVPEGMGGAPGDLSLMLDGNSGKGLKVIMTSPRVDLANNGDDASQALLESLPNTIDKNIMRRFGQNNDQVILPGSYLSGDNGTLPLGLNGISAIDQGKGMSGAISEILHPVRFRPHGSGLSPDSMLSILKQGQRPKHAVRYGPGFTQLNNSAVYNKHIYDAGTKYKSGAMSADEFKTIFDDGFVPQGGRPLEIRTPSKFRGARNNDGTKTLVQQEQTPYIVFPHPYVHYKKLGGKIENGK